MLATGKTWGAGLKDFGKDTLPPKLVGDFLDFFLFNGQGGQFAKKYGLTDFSFQYDKDAKKFGFKKEVSEGLKLGFEVQELPVERDGDPVVYSKKLEGEFKLSDRVTLDILQKVSPSSQAPAESRGDVKKDGETGVFLKYKNTF